MCAMRNANFLPRLVISLMIAAGCITSVAVTSYAWSRSAAQSAAAPPSAPDAARFLRQATWGPTPDLISQVETSGFESFLDEQFSAPVSSYPALPLVVSPPADDCPADTVCRRDNYTLYPVQTRFFTNALYGQDQLR